MYYHLLLTKSFTIHHTSAHFRRSINASRRKPLPFFWTMLTTCSS